MRFIQLKVGAEFVLGTAVFKKASWWEKELVYNPFAPLSAGLRSGIFPWRVVEPKKKTRKPRTPKVELPSVRPVWPGEKTETGDIVEPSQEKSLEQIGSEARALGYGVPATHKVVTIQPAKDELPVKSKFSLEQQ